MTTYHFTAALTIEMKNDKLQFFSCGLHYTELKHGLIKTSSQPGVLIRFVENLERS